ncbi:MAG TPA: hypothetical protein VGN32_08695 [Ktedonobacterales bacterium]|jgi:hypothetical protein|nr:hypothetical protein [Ktedonobacterales bacterium]
MRQASTVSPVAEVVEFFARGPSREAIADFRLSDATIKRLRELPHRNSADELTADEHHILDQIVLLDDIISLIRVRVQGATPPGAGSSAPTSA